MTTYSVFCKTLTGFYTRVLSVASEADLRTAMLLMPGIPLSVEVLHTTKE